MDIISNAYAEGAEVAPGAGADLPMIIVLTVCMIAVYFFIMRPNSKKRKEMQKVLDNLAVGDEVLTNGGITGRVVKLPDNREYVLLKVAENVILQMKRNYVVAVLPKGTLEAVAVEKTPKKREGKATRKSTAANENAQLENKAEAAEVEGKSAEAGQSAESQAPEKA